MPAGPLRLLCVVRKCSFFPLRGAPCAPALCSPAPALSPALSLRCAGLALRLQSVLCLYMLCVQSHGCRSCGFSVVSIANFGTRPQLCVGIYPQLVECWYTRTQDHNNRSTLLGRTTHRPRWSVVPLVKQRMPTGEGLQVCSSNADALALVQLGLQGQRELAKLYTAEGQQMPLQAQLLSLPGLPACRFALESDRHAILWSHAAFSARSALGCSWMQRRIGTWHCASTAMLGRAAGQQTQMLLHANVACWAPEPPQTCLRGCCFPFTCARIATLSLSSSRLLLVLT